MVPGILLEIPWECSCGILGMLVDALLVFIEFSWGISGHIGDVLWFIWSALYIHICIRIYSLGILEYFWDIIGHSWDILT